MDRGAWRATVSGVVESQTQTQLTCAHTHKEKEAFELLLSQIQVIRHL